MSKFKLQSHPTKERYFIDGGFGQPITRKNHTFEFNFSRFEHSKTYSIARPWTTKTDKNGERVTTLGDPKSDETERLEIEMVPSEDTVYSYIGTHLLIEKYQLIILDLNDHMSDCETPHLKVFSYNVDTDGPGTVSFTIFLFLETSRLQEIREDIINERINDGSLTFSIGERGDLVFQSDFQYYHIPRDFLKDWDYDPDEYKTLGCSYPIKLLPENFFDYDRNLIKPFDKTPIEEFSISFGKTSINYRFDTHPKRNTEEIKVIKDFQQYHLMYEVFEQDDQIS